MKYSLKSPVMALAIFATLLMTGCATQTKSNLYVTAEQSPLMIVSQESQKALNAQRALTKFKQTQNERLLISQADFEKDKILIDYIGKPEPLLSSLAIKYGYRYIELCAVPNYPTINFTNYHTTPNDALVFIDSQLGDLANIRIDKVQKIISTTC